MTEKEMIPDEGKRWFVAELVIKIAVQGDPRNVIHKNLLLIHARTNEDAYERAIGLGHEHEFSYLNPNGKIVTNSFVGLGRLSAVNDALTDGAELLYDEYLDLPEERVSALVVSKENLTVFQPVKPSRGPDYSSREILDEASKLINP